MTRGERRAVWIPARCCVRRLVTLVATTLLVAATAGAQEGTAGPDEILRRLEKADTRIAALEELARRQSEQIQTLLASATPGAPGAGPRPAASSAQEKRAGETPPERPITHPLLSLKFNGLMQLWYSGGDRGLADTFRIRRTELYFTGSVTKKARFQVMVDPAKTLSLDLTTTPVAVSQSSRILQNAFITLDYVPKVQVNIGQFKLPLSLEGLQSSGRLDTVERALFASDRARGGAYGDVRDLGLIVSGGAGRRMDFQAGVFNGVAESQNEVDRNDQKALAGRLVARPVDGLQVGTSGAWGNGGGARPRRDRYGAELQLARGAFLFRSEVMAGRDGPLNRRGFYGHVGYRFGSKVEGVFRLDGWDPDTASESTPASVSELDYVTGFNVFLSQHNLKLQVNYIRKTFGSEALPSRNLLLVNTQTFW